MEIIGLLLEIVLFGVALYLYLFSRGKIKIDPKYQERAESFRVNNQNWLRILSLGLMAIMLVNIVLHVVQLLGT